MKCFYCLLLMLCPYLSPAQPVAVKPFQPGDAVPDIPFTKMINHPAPSATLSQYKGKLVILDFWATWCSACIKKFNMLDSMQRKYPNQLQVILINAARTRDTREKIEKFFSRYKNAGGNRLVLPTTYNDSAASAYFPNTAIPLYCWITPGQTCLAITGPDEVTAKNIEAAIKGNMPAFTGLGLMDSFDYTKPLFVKGNAGNGEAIKFRSTLSGYIPGMRSGAHTTHAPNKKVIQYKMINVTLLEMITHAYWYFKRHDRIQFSVSDSLKSLLHPPAESGKEANSYAYELVCPPTPFKDIWTYVQQDIERWFGLAARFQNQPTPCLLLTVDTAILGRYRTKGGKRNNQLNNKDGRYMQNSPLSALTSFLDSKFDTRVYQKDSIPFQLDLHLPDIPVKNTSEWINALAALGIYLTPSTEMIEQFIIYQLPKQKQL